MQEYYDYLEQEQNFKPLSVYEYKRVLEHLRAVIGDPLKLEALCRKGFEAIKNN